MKKILGYIRKACEKYNMISDGDVIAVGVSGGKDSLLLLKALCMYSGFAEQKFSVKAVTIDARFGGVSTDLSAVLRMCEDLGVPHIVVPTDIGQIVFDVRKEPNPCSLCARMRRGALIDAARDADCNKIALGHNNDDVIETFMMNLFSEGRIGCFSPVTEYPDRGQSLIRPLVFAPEKDILSCCKRNGIVPVPSRCPADKHTSRQDMKLWLTERERCDRGFKLRIFGAMERGGIDGWHE